MARNLSIISVLRFKLTSEVTVTDDSAEISEKLEALYCELITYEMAIWIAI